MGASSCPQCGQPTTPGAAFCASCGAPIAPPVAAPAAPAPPPADVGAPAPPPTAPPDALPSLADRLGLGGRREFLLQHELIALAHTYRVLDRENHHLFTVRETAHRDPSMTFGAPIGQPHLGVQRVQVGPGEHDSEWAILGVDSTPVGTITIREKSGHAVCSVADAGGSARLFVDIEHSGMDKIAAKAETAQGEFLFQAHGTEFTHNFPLLGADGREVAKVHEAWASVRDSFGVEITGAVDPFSPLIFALLLDDDKGRNRPAPAHHP